MSKYKVFYKGEPAGGASSEENLKELLKELVEDGYDEDKLEVVSDE